MEYWLNSVWIKNNFVIKKICYNIALELSIRPQVAGVVYR
ncbi:Uncharacterised protein [Weeksella virosa]|uniref:Uncharacterized protein n=1 Tax=Weeksella virosa (strain ATCC 43766 / DSM 16922 / JCM 21250 / CCUG 30538 / CDC 9751 / IAM 14551 / NBRC 16016 / NCTC 11634 / CL345/78) TaxID=865938 RepID=F0P2F4_WEEVC|nr:hypothetical protein Weevi_0038 [Weeksella virosa DSM 16922]SUP53045.1 Uncharacterised protein [Weeksella virosa]VEH63511.1 Uncharacterised protein [Weeksella virosa]